MLSMWSISGFSSGLMGRLCLGWMAFRKSSQNVGLYTMTFMSCWAATAETTGSAIGIKSLDSIGFGMYLASSAVCGIRVR